MIFHRQSPMSSKRDSKSKSKRFQLVIVALLFLLAFSATARAQFTTTPDGSGGLVITGYPYYPGGSLVIPSTISGLPVTGISQSAFYNTGTMTGVTIPNSVTNIGAQAFAYCGLITATIGAGVTTIGNEAFASCTNLTSITVDPANPAYSSSAEGVLYDKNLTTLIQYPPARTATSYAIPNTVTSIGDEAFLYAGNLTQVTIPKSVNNLGYSAFLNCTGLTSITFSGAITSFASTVFQGCTSVTSVTIGNGTTSIGNFAFSNCTSLTSIIIPPTVTSIGQAAFGDCTGLPSVTIPDGVISIAQNAFGGCTSLTSITIPNSVTSIGYSAFLKCSHLASATFNGNAPTVSMPYSLPPPYGAPLPALLFAGAALNFTVSYYSGATGFTSPSWNDGALDTYPSVNLGTNPYPPQTLSTFPTIPDCNLGVLPFTITPPTASSSLPVTVTVQSGPATISDYTVTVTGTGTVALAANQGGNASFAPAPQVTTSFVVNPSTTDVFSGTPLGGGWNYSPWFGTYNSTYYPWIYRTDLGFIYVDTTDNTKLYLYVINGNPAPMGWLYTTATLCPYYYSFTKNSWLYFGGGTSFYNYSNQSWET